MHRSAIFSAIPPLSGLCFYSCDMHITNRKYAFFYDKIVTLSPDTHSADPLDI